MRKPCSNVSLDFRLRIVLTLAALLIFGSDEAQVQLVSGTLTDVNREPILDVNAIHKGMTNGLSTDFNGQQLDNIDSIDPNYIAFLELLKDGETPTEVMVRADTDVLRLILQYHIITINIAQNDSLEEFRVNYEFQTLIPGEAGKMTLRSDERFRKDINRSPASLYSAATGGVNNERVRNHNYVFNNGMGHSLNDTFRNQPYPAPKNLVEFSFFI
ncbi:MAG: hypothetical protein AAGD88_05960 [Bacteroidota bacterium]